MVHDSYAQRTRRRGRRSSSAPGSTRARLSVEALETRNVPATLAPYQSQAAQVFLAVNITVETAFEANYKVFSSRGTAYLSANLISAYLNAEKNALAQNVSGTQQSQLTLALLNQSLNYVAAEDSVLETWYFNATQSKLDADTLLTQLDALASSFQATEQTAIAAQVQELNTGVLLANNAPAFTYKPPDFISPGNGGVQLPLTTPSLTHPSFIISQMNNDTINQLRAVLANTVALVPTVTTLTPPSTTPTAGTPVTYTAKVASTTTGTPTGTVTLNVDGTPQPAATLVNGQATIIVPSMTAGAHTVTVNYSGDANFQSSSASLSQQVT